MAIVQGMGADKPSGWKLYEPTCEGSQGYDTILNNSAFWVENRVHMKMLEVSKKIRKIRIWEPDIRSLDQQVEEVKLLCKGRGTTKARSSDKKQQGPKLRAMMGMERKEQM